MNLSYYTVDDLRLGHDPMAHDTDATLDELEQLRGRCVKDVMRTHGMISFKEIFRFQKRL